MAAFEPRGRNAFMTHWHKILDDENVVTRTIVVDEAAVVGNVVSWVQDGHFEVGYWIGKEHWGKGIATRALAQFLDVVADRRPLYAWVAAHNLGSIRVLEKCGFTTDSDQPPSKDERKYVVMKLQST